MRSRSSNSDRPAGSTDTSGDDCRTAGVPLVWPIDPIARAATIIEGFLPPRRLDEGDALSGATMIPGFQCEIRELFDGLAAAEPRGPPRPEA